MGSNIPEEKGYSKLPYFIATPVKKIIVWLAVWEIISGKRAELLIHCLGLRHA
ncbi:hypothetical protein Lsha_1107 [Legionella shakespearei DSM 23087]|uniref:Uncharacterized protein n=1 Tax=Legionella shakespearei DSM 23087 TaxID=1122169 RepID=A0A0W0YZW6_9GAMM|nr:hypothetical protein Lsha_1107 [Legionella shakespearei DSM 23087]